MTVIWRKIAHKGDEAYAYCGRMDEGKLIEHCPLYESGKLCRNCRYVTGKVIEEEREDE